MKKLLFPLVMSLMALTSQAQTYHLDVNNNGSIDLTDALIVINYILGRFNPEDDQQPQSYLACPDDHHPHMIDLGLPSGTKWACCNVGATTPEGYGGYYAWGETEEKDYYDLKAYQHVYFEYGGYEHYYDIGSDIAGTHNDVAHVKWGESWVMPSKNQIQELIENCTYEWTTLMGINGGKFTGINGGSIFLPAAGHRWFDDLLVGYDGSYWSSTRHPSLLNGASYMGLFSNIFMDYDYYLYGGFTVRPVSNKAETKSYH